MPNKPKTNYQPEPGKVAKADVFQTPPYALPMLLPYLAARGIRRVRESAVGRGYLACWLHQAGMQVHGTDLDTGHDRFAADWDLAGADIECTNVPFSLKYRWIARACEQGHAFALLMPADVIYAAKRFWPLRDRYNLQILLPNKRIDYKPPTKDWIESSAQMHTAWVTRGLNLPQYLNECYINKPGERQLALLAPQWESAHAAFVKDWVPGRWPAEAPPVFAGYSLLPDAPVYQQIAF